MPRCLIPSHFHFKSCPTVVTRCHSVAWKNRYLPLRPQGPKRPQGNILGNQRLYCHAQPNPSSRRKEHRLSRLHLSPSGHHAIIPAPHDAFIPEAPASAPWLVQLLCEHSGWGCLHFWCPGSASGVGGSVSCGEDLQILQSSSFGSGSTYGQSMESHLLVSIFCKHLHISMPMHQDLKEN